MISATTLLPSPVGDTASIVKWVDTHLSHLTLEGPSHTVASGRFRGGQRAADAALQAFSVRGYAGRRSEVLPHSRRGASGLSPYIRHGLLLLPDVWAAVGAAVGEQGAPAKDVEKFRDELMWQEYSRHLYARLGSGMSRPLRGIPRSDGDSAFDPWDRSMACVSLVLDELEGDGWAINQTRMWMASQWNVRHGVDWREGEDRFFAHLLDGSRAANRAGWQWTIGSGNGKPYGFSRWQVEKRVPGVCDGCVHRRACPIQEWPNSPEWLPRPADTNAAIGRDAKPGRTAGPAEVDVPGSAGSPAWVWMTAESLGEDDPAMKANPVLPGVFVFDAELLLQLRLSSKRLVFLAETLAELAETADSIGSRLEIHLGNPVDVLSGEKVATTFAPVPGWRQRAGRIRPVEVHPWPWLRTPGSGSLQSFSAWRAQF